MKFRQGSIEPSELVMGLVGPIGCNRNDVIDTIGKLAKHFSYRSETIRMSKLIEAHAKVPAHRGNDYKRVTNLILAGNELRRRTSDNSLLAKLTAKEIAKRRVAHEDRRTIYVVDSIKHPEEVDELRHIYGPAFYLLAINSSKKQRESYLRRECHINSDIHIKELIDRDQGESFNHGQGTTEAFHRADVFLSEEGDCKKVWNTLERFFDIIFGDPFKTPTFHEYAMFMAYGASIRSADMSRQVGAVLTLGTDILGAGANECPKPNGGTYWPIYNRETGLISDLPTGRDFVIGHDPNAKEREQIIETLLKDLSPRAAEALQKNIEESGLRDITEYGRVVHAEMDAILGCARRGIATAGATLFCTTFPCHNCAKHIVCSGIRKVVYIEPYPKSKAFDLHSDTIAGPDSRTDEHVLFLPFVGVGPRQFVDLFSLTLSSGAKVRRKAGDGITRATWERKSALPRVKALPVSYLDNETTVAREAAAELRKIQPVRIR